MNIMMVQNISFLSLHLLLILLLCLRPLTTVADGNSTNIDGWCDKTPYPYPCKRYFIKHSGFRLPTQISEFRVLLVEAAMDRAVSAWDKLTNSSKNCTDFKKQAVLADCINLYGDTVMQLNRTLQGVSSKTGRRCTDFDAQTWLSTALTNTETCRRGSSDLNVSDFTTPIVSNTKISHLISNCLAVNGALLTAGKNDSTTGDSKGFPTWVSRKERRLLQLQSVRANLVVAKDGSGHFKTVQAAIDVAGRRKVTSGRFVIYVKRGIYQENINVRLNNDNIMLVGDGMRYTIITGGRSVKGGYTTYSSATAGSTYGLDTLFYAEYKNIGPASSTRWRVRWKGFHVLSKASDASAFSVGKFIAGTAWLPGSGIPFTSEL
ncbi:unnamed protein product [Arabidopsis thaliana]|uniref:Pectinesterase n=1 Tax=Arabidopsis thaliana TaxID=3702 RepID=A0A7G2FJC8_ARATH|nr:unnamed protein product [Arabidopsis thaliana]